MADEKKVEKKGLEITSMKELVLDLITAESDFRWKKLETEDLFSDKLVKTDWDKLNAERKEQGLPKLSNQDMKKAHILLEMGDDYRDLLLAELKYNKLRRFYDMSMKYSFDILR